MNARVAPLLLVLLGCSPKTAGPGDNDGDGLDEAGGDCNDADATVFPGAPEHCDGRDEDCDGAVDEEPVDAVTAYVDADGDGVTSTTAVTTCSVGPDQSATPGDDCDDADPAVHPGAEERCNTGVDEDCDGTAGECVRTGELPIAEGELQLLGAGPYQWGSALAAMGDADGDGHADLAVGYSPAPMGSSPDGAVSMLDIHDDGAVREVSAVATIDGFDPRSVTAYLLASGDLDGDGGADLLVSCPGAWSPDRPVASVQLYLSPFDGSRDAGDSDTFFAGTDEDGLGEGLAVLGDVDGDGLDDLAIGAPWTRYDISDGSDPGHVYVWFSRSAADWRATDSPDAIFEGYSPGSHFGGSVTGLPDVDGDGLADLATGSVYDSGGGGAVYVHTGLRAGSFDAGDAYGTRLSSDSSAVCGHTISAWGDDLAIACSGSRRLWVIPPAELRGYGVLEESGLTPIGEPDGGAGVYPSTLADGGDIDGDGTADLLVGTVTSGAGWIFYGSGARLQLTTTDDAHSELGWSLTATDGDGDGLNDAFFGDPTSTAVWGVRGRGM